RLRLGANRALRARNQADRGDAVPQGRCHRRAEAFRGSEEGDPQVLTRWDSVLSPEQLLQRAFVAGRLLLRLGRPSDARPTGAPAWRLPGDRDVRIASLDRTLVERCFAERCFVECPFPGGFVQVR